jgi:hypothetical protein
VKTLCLSCTTAVLLREAEIHSFDKLFATTDFSLICVAHSTYYVLRQLRFNWIRGSRISGIQDPWDVPTPLKLKFKMVSKYEFHRPAEGPQLYRTNIGTAVEAPQMSKGRTMLLSEFQKINY